MLLLLPALVWATKRSRPDTEDSKVPQINPNGIVLDYADLPKITDVIADLKPKAQAELSPELAAKLEESMDGFHSGWILEQTEWKPACARLIWLCHMDYWTPFSDDSPQVLLKAVEHGDFQLLKDYIDYHDFETKNNLLFPYFEKYGLMHAQHLDKELLAVYEEWRSFVGFKNNHSLLPKSFIYLLSDYSKDHQLRFKSQSPIYCPSSIDFKLHLVASYVESGKKAASFFSLDAYSYAGSNFKNLAMIEKLCIAYGVPDCEAGLQDIAGPMWTLYKANNVTSETLDEAFELHGWRSGLVKDGFADARLLPLIDIFHSAFQTNTEWFESKFSPLHFSTKLLLAFHYPELLPHVTLPGQMPPIEQILNPAAVWSFEKAEYFKFISENYGYFAISQAMLKHGGYSNDAYFHLAVISNPSIVINPQKYEYMRPTDLSDEEKLAWWNFFTHRTQPISNSAGNLRLFGMPLNG